MPNPFEASTVKASQFQGVVGDHATVTFRHGDHFHGVKDDRIELRLNMVSSLPAVLPSNLDESELADRVQQLRDRRLLVIVRSASGTQAAREALYALLARVCSENAQATRFTHLDSEPLPLHGFLRSDSWTHALRGSIIYLDRSQVVDTLDEEFVQSLIERLCKADALLILMTTRAAAQAAQADLAAHSVRAPASIPTWQIGADDDQVDECRLNASLNDPVGLPVLACASLLPGLGLDEFVGLIDALTPETAALGGLAQPQAGAAAGHPSPSIVKWVGGAHDDVMGLHGVGFMQPATPIDGAMHVRGCHLVDQHALPATVARLLSDRPAFLRRMRAEVLSRYFAAGASARLQTHALRFLMLLHATGIHRFQSTWIRDQFIQALNEPDEGESLHRLLGLVLALLDEDGGPTLVEEVCEAIAQHGTEMEAAWHRSFQQAAAKVDFIGTLNGSQANPSAAVHEAQEIALASSFVRGTELDGQFNVLVSQSESLLLWFLYLAGLEGSREAAIQGLLTLLAGPGEREVQRDIHDVSAIVGTLFTPVQWLLPLGLVKIVERIPANWSRLAQTTCEALHKLGNAEPLRPTDLDTHAFSGSPARRRHAAVLQLAQACMQGFEALVSRSVAKGFAAADRDALMNPDTISTNAAALATLMTGRSSVPFASDARAGRPVSGSFMSLDSAGRLLEGLCRASTQEATEAGTTAAAIEYVACYRARLTRGEHRAILEWARERTSLYRQWAEYHLAVRDRAAARHAYARLHASNLFSRALHSRPAATHDTERLS